MINDYTIFDNSMNGIKTLSDGISTMENGVITSNTAHINTINGSIGNFSNLSSQELTDHNDDIKSNTDRIKDLEDTDETTTTQVQTNKEDILKKLNHTSGTMFNNVNIRSNTNYGFYTDYLHNTSTNDFDVRLQLRNNIVAHGLGTLDCYGSFNISQNLTCDNISGVSITTMNTAIGKNKDDIFDNTNAIGYNDADILALQQNLILTGVMPDISTNNITMNANKSITQSGTTNNQLQTTTITNLSVTSSLTLPADILIPSAVHTGEVVYAANAWIDQDISTPNINPNTFRDSYFTDLFISEDINMTNPAAYAFLKNLVTDEDVTFNKGFSSAAHNWIYCGTAPSTTPANRIAFTTTGDFAYCDYGLNALIFRSNGTQEKMRLTNTGKLNIQDDFSTINGKSIMIGNGFLTNDQRLRLYHSTNSHSYIDFGSGDLFFRNNILNSILQMKSVDNSSIFNYNVSVNGDLTGPTITGITDRITDLEDEFTTHGDYGALATQVQTNKDDIVTKLNHNGGTAFGAMDLRSSVSHGFIFDFMSNASTNDYDVRLQLAHQEVANGMGQLNCVGSFNVSQNLKCNNITGTTITTINTRVQTLEDNKDEHNNDTVSEDIVTLNGQVAEITEKNIKRDFMWYGAWTRIGTNGEYEWRIPFSTFSANEIWNFYGQAWDNYGTELNINTFLSLDWYIKTADSFNIDNSDPIYKVPNNSIDPNFRNGICSSFRVDGATGDVVIKLKTAQDSIFSSYFFQDFAPLFDNYIQVGGGNVELFTTTPRFYNLTNGYMRCVVTTK